MRLVLGVDLGTTGVRCAVFDERLQPLSTAYRETPPTHLGQGRVEQDPEAWVEGAAAVIGAALEGLEPSRVASISFSTQGITVVPVDGRGRPLRPALSWLDTRADAELQTLGERLDAESLQAVTGKPWRAVYSLPKVLWLQHHERDVMTRCARLLTPMDYLVMRFAGLDVAHAVTDHTTAGGTMAYSNELRGWDPGIATAAGVPLSLWPDIVEAGTPVGNLCDDLARRTGLPTTSQVVVGGQDQKCAAYGAGISPGYATVSIGTAAAVSSLRDSPEASPGIPLFSWLTGRRWVAEASMPAAGAALRWFLHTASPACSFNELNELAMRAHRDDAPLHVPLRNEARDLGASFVGLQLDTTPEQMAWSMFEGIAYEIERLRRQMGADGNLRLFGGGAQSPVWGQLLADLGGGRVEIPVVHEAAARGAALLAGSAVGLWDSADAAAASVETARSYEPRDVEATCRRFDVWLGHREPSN